MSCIDKSEYYVQLEDDVIANPKYLKFIYQKIMDQVDNWFMLEFSSLGFIGKLFRTQSLTVINFYVFFYYFSYIFNFQNFQKFFQFFFHTFSKMMCEFVLMFWKDKPVDWLLEHMMYTRVCNPERDMHICQIEKRKIKVNLQSALKLSLTLFQKYFVVRTNHNRSNNAKTA